MVYPTCFAITLVCCEFQLHFAVCKVCSVSWATEVVIKQRERVAYLQQQTHTVYAYTLVNSSRLKRLPANPVPRSSLHYTLRVYVILPRHYVHVYKRPPAVNIDSFYFARIIFAKSFCWKASKFRTSIFFKFKVMNQSLRFISHLKEFI